MTLITALCGRGELLIVYAALHNNNAYTAGPMILWFLPFTKARIPDPVPPADLAFNQFIV